MGIIRLIKEKLNPKERPVCTTPINQLINEDLKDALRQEKYCKIQIDHKCAMTIMTGTVQHPGVILLEIRNSELVEHLSANNSEYLILITCQSGKYSIKLEKS